MVGQKTFVEHGDQLIIFRGDRIQLRTPTGPHSYTVKVECECFRTEVWKMAEFLSKLSGLHYETYRLPGWATATAVVFLEPGQKATEEQKKVAT